jgi:hypothetical protein
MISKKNILILGLIFFGLFFLFSFQAQAQNNSVVLTINPAYPEENQAVQATLSSYVLNLDNARISWILDGQTMLEGIGRKTFSFQVGSSEFQTALEAKIETLDGILINKKILISPAKIDIFWEAYDAYVPPFYRGRSLPSAEGMIKVVAFPNAQNLAGFNYQWKLDGKNKPSSSGYGKNYFIYKNSYLEDSNAIKVIVSDIFGNGLGQESATIRLGRPEIVFYRKDPVLGIRWEEALTDWTTIAKDGETIVAEPYFLYPKNLNATGLSFNWLLNGERIENQNPKNYLSVKPGEKSGNALIQLIINNGKVLFGDSEKKLRVSF